MTRSRRILWLLATAYLVFGVATAFPPAKGQTSVLDLLIGIPLVAAIYSWCRADSVEHGRAPPGRWAVWAALLPPLILPVYFFRTRKWPAALLAIAKALGLYLLLMVIAVVSGMLAAFVAVLV